MEEQSSVAIERVDTLIVLIGVILGLSIGKFVAFVGHLLVERKQVRFSVPYAIFMLSLFVYQVYYWWSIWELQYVGDIDFVDYLRMLLIPLLLYGATAVLAPDLEKHEGFAMRQHMDEHSRVFFGIAVVLITTGILQGYHFWEQRGLQIWLRVAALGLVSLGLIFKSHVLNWILAMLLLLNAVVFVYAIVGGYQTIPELLGQ